MPKVILVDQWGRDHHSTLLYAETRAVDHAGVLTATDRHMRQGGVAYPTRLRDESVVYGHDDYDCLLDAEAAGYLTYKGSVVRFTHQGYQFVHGLRRERAERNAPENKDEERPENG